MSKKRKISKEEAKDIVTQHAPKNGATPAWIMKSIAAAFMAGALYQKGVMVGEKAISNATKNGEEHKMCDYCKKALEESGHGLS